MINDTKARAALVQAAKEFLTGNASINTPAGLVEGLPTIPGDSIAWENRVFTTQGKALWASVFYRPNTPSTRSIGPGGIDETTGFLQIDLNIGEGEGENLLIEWENKARLFFHHGRFFSYNGHSVIVTSAGMGQGRHVGNDFRKSLTVFFRSQTKRPQLI